MNFRRETAVGDLAPNTNPRWRVSRGGVQHRRRGRRRREVDTPELLLHAPRPFYSAERFSHGETRLKAVLMKSGAK